MNKIFPSGDFQVPFLQQMEQNENMQLFITSADAIRGIQPTDEQPQGALIKTNFNALLLNLDKLLCTGSKVNNSENKYQIVGKDIIFDRNNEIMNLGKVKDLQIILPELEWFNEYMFRLVVEK